MFCRCIRNNQRTARISAVVESVSASRLYLTGRYARKMYCTACIYVSGRRMSRITGLTRSTQALELGDSSFLTLPCNIESPLCGLGTFIGVIQRFQPSRFILTRFLRNRFSLFFSFQRRFFLRCPLFVQRDGSVPGGTDPLSSVGRTAKEHDNDDNHHYQNE